MGSSHPGTTEAVLWVLVKVPVGDYATVLLVFFYFFIFLPFLGPLPRHMEIPRLGVESEP